MDVIYGWGDKQTAGGESFKDAFYFSYCYCGAALVGAEVEQTPEQRLLPPASLQRTLKSREKKASLKIADGAAPLRSAPNGRLFLKFSNPLGEISAGLKKSARMWGDGWRTRPQTRAGE